MNAGVALAAIAGGFLALVGFGRLEPTADSKPAPAGIAVVELFTSEGCSSCPSADEALTALATRHAGLGERVVPLAFHVDYWDKLGWPDRFASAEFTRRQRAYASGIRGLYTPQMVVNGRVEFVGSDRARAAKAIESELRVPAIVSVQAARVVRSSADAIEIAVELTVANGAAMPKGAVIVAALVEDGLTSVVGRGENAGRTLRHDRVVRAMASARPDEQRRAKLEMAPPKDVDLAKSRVVVFVQVMEEGRPGAIIGAVQIPAK